MEEYNEYGEIIKREPPPEIYERRMTTHQEHRIHQTKDLFDGNCYLCQRAAEKGATSHWADED